MNIKPREAPTADADRVTVELVVTNKLGLHARPAAMFVKLTNQHACEVWVEKDGEEVNGKSIMGLMMLAAGQGSRLTVTAVGKDARQAVEAIRHLLDSKFNED